jgi:uncharacterized membrane protein
MKARTFVHHSILLLKKPEWVFLIISLFSGVGLCFLIPTQSGFDEITHLARIWEISGGYLIPNQRLSQGPYLPMAFVDISYRNQFFYDPVSPDFFSTHGNERINWNNFLNHQTRSVYFPTLYLPQAFAVGLLGRVLNAPVLLIVTICRLLYLLGYILLAYCAIRLIPFGKWLLLVLTVAPMAMFQAATISPDSYTNGACFLFIAWVLRLSFQEKPINWKQLWLTIGITTLLLSVKINAVFLLPLLLLLVFKGFAAKKMLPILAGAVGLLFAVEVVGWNALAYSKYYVNMPGFGVLGQLAYIISNPAHVGAILVHDFFIHGIAYLREWVAVYGYNAGQVPPVTYVLFVVVLVAAWLLSPAEKSLNTRTRITLILTGIAGCFFTILILYLSFTRIGSTSIDGVQGRYFIPVIPVLLLGLVPGRELLSRKVARVDLVVGGAGAVFILAFYILGMYLSFYTVCGTGLYSPGLCYQPRYRNWDPNAHFTQPVMQDLVLQQTFSAVCTPLRSVRVWSASPLQEMAGETRISLKDAGNGAVLMEKRVDNQTAANHAWLNVPFPPVGDAVGKQFIIGITSDLTKPAEGLSFGVTSRREYLYGVVINNNPMDYDLIFQYGCGQ